MGFCMGSGNGEEGLWPAYTKDGLLDRYGKPAVRGRTGGWKSGLILLVNQGLGTLAFYGVEANMIPFSKTVMRQTNAEAEDTFSRWMGAVYLFSLIAAFLSDSPWKIPHLEIFLFCLGLLQGFVLLSVSTHAFLLKPHGCGVIGQLCDPHAPFEVSIFYISIYLIALGNGISEPAFATFGADQFDEEDPEEKQSKMSFYSYYVALNIGCLCAIVAFVLLLSGTRRYRHFKPSGNPVSRIAQVIVHSANGMRRILHTDDFVIHTDAFSFVEQGAAMDRTFLHFQVPPASMTVFDIVSTSIFIVFYDKLFIPLYLRLTRKEPKTLTELQRIGIGLAIAVVAMLASGLVEQQRLKYSDGSKKEMSSLSIFWQTPQYILVGVSGAFPRIGLSLSSSALGSCICSIILGLVMKITMRNEKPGWVPPNLNDGHLDRFFFLSAALSMLNLGLFVVCSNRYKCISLEKRDETRKMEAKP
ncbi:hypothetical protein AAG906_022883 [Vitis piasezkii]